MIIRYIIPLQISCMFLISFKFLCLGRGRRVPIQSMAINHSHGAIIHDKKTCHLKYKWLQEGRKQFMGEMHLKHETLNSMPIRHVRKTRGIITYVSNYGASIMSLINYINLFLWVLSEIQCTTVTSQQDIRPRNKIHFANCARACNKKTESGSYTCCGMEAVCTRVVRGGIG